MVFDPLTFRPKDVPRATFTKDFSVPEEGIQGLEFTFRKLLGPEKERAQEIAMDYIIRFMGERSVGIDPTESFPPMQTDAGNPIPPVLSKVLFQNCAVMECMQIVGPESQNFYSTLDFAMMAHQLPSHLRDQISDWVSEVNRGKPVKNASSAEVPTGKPSSAQS